MSIFLIFVKLGLTSFGGPISHIGYFRDEFVTRRRWISENLYAEIVTLCQFLPGPTSSQVGFLIGLHRGGALGATLAWLGFTAPSAIVMMAFAFGVVHFDGPKSQALIHGLKLVAVVVVTQAVWGMSRTLTPDRIRIMIAVLSATMIILSGNPPFQLTAVVFGAGLGIAFCRTVQSSAGQELTFPISRVAAYTAFFAFISLFVCFGLFSNLSPIIIFVAKFYQTGSLVFGGGHVVLPLLEHQLVGPALIDQNIFLAGYGATQAVPGPLFTFASYVGVLASSGPGGVLGGLLATVAIFLPGLLLVIALVPFWTRWRENVTFRSAIAGANAAVVGVLGATLYDPIVTNSVTNGSDFILIVTGYLLVVSWRTPIWAIVILLPSAAFVREFIVS